VPEIRLPKPHAGQALVLSQSRRFNVLMCGRRFGKTTLGIRKIVQAAANGQPTAWCSPTYKMLSQVWRQVEALLHPIILDRNKQERRLELLGGGSIDFWSLDAPDSIRGQKYALVVCDEISLVRDFEAAWTGTLRPTLTDLRGGAWFFMTPKGRGYPYSLYLRGQSGDDAEWSSWRLRSVDNTFISPDEVESARRDMPAHVFAQEYEGVPADDAGNPFGLGAVNACTGPLSGEPATAYGVDLAMSQDWTVVIGLDAQRRVCSLDRWQSDWDSTYKRVLSIVGNTPTYIDSTGLGGPVFERLDRDRPGVFTPYTFTAPSKQALMMRLVTAIQSVEVSFPVGTIVDELSSFAYEFRPGGRVIYSAPSGYHDDCVCALALSLLAHDAAPTMPAVTVVRGRAPRPDLMWREMH